MYTYVHMTEYMVHIAFVWPINLAAGAWLGRPRGAEPAITAQPIPTAWHRKSSLGAWSFSHPFKGD